VNQPNTRSAAIALAAAWAACADGFTIASVPKFRVAGGPTLDLEAAAAALARETWPACINATWAADVLVIYTSTPSDEDGSFGQPHADPADLWGVPSNDPNVLVIGDTIRLRVTTGDLRAYQDRYVMGMPSVAAQDYVPSGFVAGLNLSLHELAGVSEVIVFGRAEGNSWSFPVSSLPG
jgi:hypothetical protein